MRKAVVILTVWNLVLTAALLATLFGDDGTELELAGPDDTARVNLSAGVQGQAALGIYGAQAGRVAAYTSLDGVAAGWRLFDEEERVRLEAGLGARPSQPYVSLQDPAGRPRLAMALRGAAGETPEMRFADGQGRLRLHIGLTEEGEPFIEMLDAEGNRVYKVP